MIAELTAFAEVAKKLVGLVKETSSLLPDGDQKQQIERELKTAERELAIAEATTAKELGHELCQCTFPPQIMLRIPEGSFKCGNCGRTTDKYAGIASAGSRIDLSGY